MRFGSVFLVVAQLVFTLTVSPIAAAEETPPTTADDSSGQTAEVAAEDLALGQPAPAEPAEPAEPAGPAATAEPSHAPPQTVGSPGLAAAAVISDGTQTTAVVDIRLLPKRLPYRGEQAIDGYVLDERRRWWMIIAGGALFGIGYIAAVAAANEHDFQSGLGFTAVPIAGPWIALATHDENCSDDIICATEDRVEAPLVLGGIMQAAGAVLLPIGIMSIKQVWLRKDLAVGLVPSRMGRNGYGALLGGRF